MEVDYGPAGFAVTVGGAVSWTPSGPMFDRSVDQNWSVRLHDSPGVHVQGTITVTDATRKYPLMRTNMGIPSGDATIDVQDFDNTGHKQALIGSGRILYIFGKSGTDYVQTWAYPFDSPDSSPITAVASGDADGDGHREIFFAAGSAIVKLDGVDRREAARYSNISCTIADTTASMRRLNKIVGHAIRGARPAASSHRGARRGLRQVRVA